MSESYITSEWRLANSTPDAPRPTRSVQLRCGHWKEVSGVPYPAPDGWIEACPVCRKLWSIVSR